jgi:hypothetical protein
MKKIKFITAALLMLSFISCGNANTSTKPSDEAVSNKTDVPSSSANLTTDPTAELEKAQKAGNVVFMVITGKGATGLDNMINAANQANKKVKKSVVIQLNKDDNANSKLVSKYGIAGVAVPFVLVISGKGLAVGGLPAGQATADALVKLVPSPKYDEVLVAINSIKPVFVVASKKTFTDKAAVMTNCKVAAKKLSNNAPVIIEVDMGDANETAFLKQIGVDISSTNTATVVITSSGNVSGNYSGVTDVQKLADAAVKVVKSCCPAGSSSGCGKK